MMIMLKSLPTCTIVLDRNCKIAEINQSGLDFLNVRSKDDYRVKRIGVLNDLNYIKKIIIELTSGRIVRDKTHFVICGNGQFRVVNFSACMIEGSSKMFVFQFFELSTFPNSYTEFQSNIAYRYTRNVQLINKSKKYSSVKNLVDGSGKKTAYRCYLSDSTIQLFARKYSGLTHNEVVICTLIVSNLSINEISKTTNKLKGNIQGSIYRIMNKFQVESRQDLYERLKLELPHSCD